MKTLLLAFALLVPTAALATIPDPPPLNGHPIVDAANVVPDDQEAQIEQKLINIEQKSHHQVAVLTTPSLGGYSIDEYGVNAGRKWGIGSKYSDDGILITIAPNERKVRIDVGYGMGSLVTDAKAQAIRQDMTPYLHEGDYAGGIDKAVDEIADAIVPPTPAEQALKAREEANRSAAAAATMAKVKDFFIGLFGILAALGGAFGIYWKATAKSRAAKRAEKARLEAEAREAEQARVAELYRQRAAAAAERARKEAAALAEERRKREAMLAAMSPAARAGFLENERREAEEAERRRRQREEEDRKRREQDEADRRRRASYSSSSSSSSSSYGGYGGGYSSDSSDSGFSGGGGSFGGGGSSGGF